MNFRVMQPAVLVDLNPLNELSYIRSEDDGGLRIGAMTRLRQLERDPLVATRVPLLHAALPHIAHAQIRNRGIWIPITFLLYYGASVTISSE